MSKGLLFLAGLGLISLVLILGGLALFTPITPSGIFYLLGLGLIGLAGLSFPWNARKAKVIFVAGLLIFLLTVGTRLATTRGNAQMYVITLPAERDTRFINRLVDEQDLTMFGTRLLPFVRLILPEEAVGAIPAFQAAYDEIHRLGGNVPSPVAATYLGLQNTKAFDIVVIEPNANTPIHAGVIFLHGFMGNFLMECGLFAQAVREAGLLTVCPSASLVGDWWKPYGAEIFEKTLAYLHARGVERVYLVGLSNGGAGACELGNQYAGQLSGLMFISGLSLEVPVSHLSVLVIQGSEDRRMPVSRAQEYARLAPNVTYHEFGGDHFLLAKEAEAVQSVITLWLIEQEGAR